MGLVDTGATKNYISKIDVLNGRPIKLSKSFLVKTLHGCSEVTHFVMVNLFSYDLKFFIVNNLGKFNFFLGMDGLNKIQAKLDLPSLKLIYSKKMSNHINYTIHSDVNQEVKNVIEKLVKANISSQSLPFNTKVEANIRTLNNEPIWTKQYPYPYAYQPFVNGEVEKLLKNDIIRPSHSPYNSPIWVVPKKGFDEHGNPKNVW